jgi:hypothetical protein
VINTVPVITAHTAATSHPFESDPVAGSNAAATTVVVVAATVVVVAATVVVVSAGGVYVDIIVNASLFESTSVKNPTAAQFPTEPHDTDKDSALGPPCTPSANTTGVA